MSNPYTEWLEDKYRQDDIYKQILDLFMEFHLNFAVGNKISYEQFDEDNIIVALAYEDWENELSICHFNTWLECAEWCYSELDIEYYNPDDSNCIDNVKECIEEIHEQIKGLFKEADKYE